jgi:hypothetical protein
MYAPMQFEEFSILAIVQEDGAGHRILEEAVRVWPESSGRPAGRRSSSAGRSTGRSTRRERAMWRRRRSRSARLTRSQSK